MDYDVVVIGAGIHGAGVAQAAAAAGYRILLLEQYAQPAAGSSSRSSKLIHGGLRYLENGQIGLVRECLRERRRLLDIAPHLVRLTPFHIPVYRDTRRRPWQIRLGLSLYALLGGKGFQQVPAAAWPDLDGLRTDTLDSVFRYYDAQTDDAQLTRSVLASATSLGADIRYRCSVERVVCEHEQCTVFYRGTGERGEVRTRVLVNAAGPWVNSVLERMEPVPGPPAIDLVQGAHLVIPGTLRQGMYYLEAPQDGRAVFVMPWKDNILLGTTESLFTGKPEDVRVLEREISYLLEVYNHYFAKTLDASQLIETFAGLRVLPKTENTVFHRSRDTLLHQDRDRCRRVLSIYGGKLTSYRATAEKVIQKLAPLLPPQKKPADTRTLPLP
ncbi:MAG: glycerol-3-phosphate dehydrogenase/oxidase [Thiogranum sp.]